MKDLRGTFKPAFRSLVEALDGSGCPTTVGWGIGTVVVNPLDSEFGIGALTHIRQEVLEAIAPTLTNDNPPTAVVLKTAIRGIVAAILHCLPDHVLWHRSLTLPPACTRAVLGHDLHRAITREASARVGDVTSEIARSDYREGSAVTSTQPPHLAALVRQHAGYHDKTSEAVSSKVNKEGHRSIEFTLRPVVLQ